jgi:hypothetical protein
MATVKFYLNHPYQPGTKTFRKDEVSIDLMFYIDQQNRFPLSTGERIQPKYWSKEMQQAKPNYTGHAELNLHLARMKQEVLQAWRDNKDDLPKLKEIVRTIVKGEPVKIQKKTVVEAVRLFIAQYEREKEKATVGRYRVLLNKLTLFNPELTFEELDFNFYDAFKRFLYETTNPVYGGYHLRFNHSAAVWDMAANQSKDMVLDGRNTALVGLMDDVVFKYFTQIKTICLWASKRGYTVHPSYKEWEIIKREYPIISLTLDELQRVENLNNLPTHLEISKDYLAVCCRTGQRISDVKRISALAISQGTWQIFQKKGSRQKQKVVELPLKGFCSPVIDIVNKYGGKLPTLSEQKINEHIKTVCKLAGIDQEIYIERWAGNKKIRIPGKKYEFISSHCGKKSFITILANSGCPIKVISDLTGTSIKTIEKHYLGKTDMHIVDSYLTKVQENVTTLKKVCNTF